MENSENAAEKVTFETKSLYIAVADICDYVDIANVYNSNRLFLRAHMEKEEVDESWVEQEASDMNEMGFNPCKIVEKSSGNTIGLLDFKEGHEAYLSLIMIHGQRKGKGLGREAYKGLEKFLCKNGAVSIKLDVVTGYDDSVLEFWNKRGFGIQGSTKLSWNGKELTAVAFKKGLQKNNRMLG